MSAPTIALAAFIIHLSPKNCEALLGITRLSWQCRRQYRPILLKVIYTR